LKANVSLRFGVLGTTGYRLDAGATVGVDSGDQSANVSLTAHVGPGSGNATGFGYYGSVGVQGNEATWAQTNTFVYSANLNDKQLIFPNVVVNTAGQGTVGTTTVNNQVSVGLVTGVKPTYQIWLVCF
jgi:hypothetical protein